MNRKVLTLIGATTLALAMAGCSQGGDGSLTGGNEAPAWDPESQAGGEGNTWDHDNNANPNGVGDGVTDKQQLTADQVAIGSAEVVARLHATSKLQYASLGNILSSVGVNVANNTANSAGLLYRNGQSALGFALYASRVREQLIPTTAALAKQFDIFVAAAPEIVANIANSRRCPGVVLVANNVFNADGISCLIGKPAREEHVILANQLVTQATTPQLGVQIAVATMLAAAHTNE
jgi:hypothetical protein